MKRWAAATAVALAALLGAPTPAAAQAAATQGQSGATWAGANVLGAGYTGTVATLTVPTVAATSPWDSAVAVWVGVDGAAGSGSLVQTGINLAPVSAGGDSAWWTTCGTQPGGHGCGEQPIRASVRPGDRIRMAVADVGVCRWRMSLTDMRSGRRAWWWGATIGYCASGPPSVEWVAEGWEPAVPWPNFGTMRFAGIWLQRPDRHWTPGHLAAADSLYSNWMHGLAEERSGNPTVCAAGSAAGETVTIVWRNTCGGA